MEAATKQRTKAQRLIGERELTESREEVEELEAKLAKAREKRNERIYHACENGMTERQAADTSGVSYGWAGRCHRWEGHPEREKEQA